MRTVGLLVGLVVAGAIAVGASMSGPLPKPTLVIAGAGLLATGIAGLAVEGFDAAVARWDGSAVVGRDGGLRDADRLVITLGATAVFARIAVVRFVADPLRIDGAVLTVAAVSTIGVAVGYRSAERLRDGARQGLLACGLGGALCVSIAAYDASGVAAVETFDAVVAGSGVVLPIVFGLLGGLSGAAGWWLADSLAGADPLA